MNWKSALVCCSLLFISAACSGDKSSDAPSSSPAKSTPTSSPSQSVDAPVQKNVAAANDGSCLSIFESDCISCHNENRSCQKLGKKDKARWKRTIDRMMKRGSKLSPADQETLLDCLADESADIVQMCK
nr:hypothetical protein [Desulfobulbaceae bacterium]